MQVKKTDLRFVYDFYDVINMQRRKRQGGALWIMLLAVE